MKRPLILITLAYTAGLLLGRGFLYFPITVIILTALAAAASLILLLTARIFRRRFFLITIPCLVGMASYVYSAAWFPSDHYTRVFTIDEARHKVTGRIISSLDRDPGRTSFIIAAESIDNITVSGRLRVSVRDEGVTAGYGDTVRVTGRVYKPRGFQNPGGFDYAEYLAQKGIYATASVRAAENIAVLRRGRGAFRTIQDWRERIRQSFRSATLGPGSAILQAMVIGDESGLTDEIRDRFMAAGVTHILSISGSHLGLVAVVCFGMIRWLTFLLPERTYLRLTIHADPKKIAAWLTLPLVVFYALLAGGQVATLRSLVMILAALAAVVLDRENGLMHSLAAAALLILVASPQAVFDISFQLSYISVVSIGYVILLWNDLRLPSRNGLAKLRNSAVILIMISLSTSLAAGPLVARYFNQISLAGVFSNMLVVPFAGFAVVPLGLISGILSLFTGSLPLPGLNQFTADAFFAVVTFFSRLPFAEFHPPSPGMLFIAAYALLLASFAGYARARLLYAFKPLEFSARPSLFLRLGMAASGSALIISLVFMLTPQRDARVTFLDVGQGDCALIELPAGRNILIDGGGTSGGGFDIGRKVVAPFLWNRGVRRLDLVVLSHPHPDHVNGLKFILKKFAVAGLWTGEGGNDAPGYIDITRIASEKGILFKAVSAEEPPARIGEAELQVLHPTLGFFPWSRKTYAALNSRSLVVLVRLYDTRLLFTGDIQNDAESALLRTQENVKCDLLKVPHHGSESSSTEAFVSGTRPKTAVISVGKGNRYGQPSPRVTAGYERAGASVLRTDRDGAVIVTVDRRGMHILPWAGLVMEIITLEDAPLWGAVERKNWERINKRIREAV